jgi:hypothetical protein
MQSEIAVAHYSVPKVKHQLFGTETGGGTAVFEKAAVCLAAVFFSAKTDELADPLFDMKDGKGKPRGKKIRKDGIGAAVKGLVHHKLKGIRIEAVGNAEEGAVVSPVDPPDKGTC